MKSLPLKFWRGLYALALVFAYPYALLRPWLRAWHEPAYAQRRSERFGRLPSGIPTGVIWFHSVSAGEVIAAAELIRTLADEFAEQKFLVTTTTPTGSAQVERLLTSGHTNISHCYAPFDFPHAVARCFTRLQPRLLVLLETELWPNMIARAVATDVPVLLINARLSDRSAARYQRIRPLVQEMLGSLRFLACQTREHADHFLALGAAADRMSVCGTLKFDLTLAADYEQQVEQLESDWELALRFVWIAGSTHAGEEALLLDAHEQLLAVAPGALLILAPRHPARANELVALLRSRGLRFVRRSEEAVPVADTQVVLLDTLGELDLFYGLSAIAFLGGSLVGVGGHNPIEAAIWGQPLLMGPHTFNFPEVVAKFVDAGALRLVSDAQAIRVELLKALDVEGTRAARGALARQVVLENRGALTRLQTLLRGEIRAISSPGSAPPVK